MWISILNFSQRGLKAFFGRRYHQGSGTVATPPTPTPTVVASASTEHTIPRSPVTVPSASIARPYGEHRAGAQQRCVLAAGGRVEPDDAGRGPAGSAPPHLRAG